MKAVSSAGPYARGARGYWNEGYTPLPLPPKSKWAPPSDWTGGAKTHSGEYPSEEQLVIWGVENGSGNICIRLPKNVIGIDVDMYDGKAGGTTLAAAEEAWGELPATWISSSRTDGSGIRWFTIPEGLAWPGQLPQGGGIEIVRWDHRYAVVAPSIHPNGRTYVWINPEGNSTTGEKDWEFPGIDELPALPEAWVDGLTGGKPWVPRAEEDLSSEEVIDWLRERGDDPACEVMERTLAHHLTEIRKAGVDGGAHDKVRNGIWAVIGDSAAGHKGLRPALTKLKASFFEAVKARRGDREKSGEWSRALEEAVRKVAAEGDPEDEDICAYGATAHTARTSRRGAGNGSAEFEYARNDAGNARRFARRYRDAIVWVDGLGGWHVWDSPTGRWRLDSDGEAIRMALATVAAIEEEVKFLEDPKEQAKLRSFINASSNDARVTAMLRLAKAMKGMTLSADRFNANPAHLVVANGTVELNPGGSRFRPSVQEDYNTEGTKVRYTADASSALWESFLTRSIPDQPTRDWVQKAVGYSLYGANTARLFFLVQGETSSGKSTFGEVIRDVLGNYGAPFNLSLFRSEKEQGPNVQLVKLLPKRFILASEASSEVHLHADQIKRLTGGEAMSARLNRANEMVERVPAFTPWLVTNAAPTVRGADLALYRRIYTIPFDQTIEQSEEDGMLGYRLKAEGAEGVLSWAIAGWKRYAAEGLGDVPAAVVTATMKTQEELSEFDVWLHEACVRGAEERAISAELYESYIQWCELARIRPESRITFGQMLGKRGLKSQMLRLDPKGDRDKKARGWAGISLKSGW